MKLLKRLLLAAVIVFIVFVWIYQKEINIPNNNQFGEKEFIIEIGQGVKTIAHNLENQGFLERPFWFKLYVWLSGKKARFVDGTYNIKTNLSVKQLVVALLDQEKNKEEDIKIIEGWTAAEIDQYLSKEKGLIDSGELVKYSGNYNKKNWLFLIDRPANASLEGYLYPDTYRVYKKTDAAQIVEKMLNNFNAKLTDELRDEIKKQKKSFFEIITMASIVEREMFGYEERRNVAGIFWNRIKIGMPLQSDATVNYITKKGTARPSLADLKIDNRYNTYKYYGLPPGPICNPSIEAIKAAIYPIKNDNLYFITTPDGRIIYAKTHEEHLKNINKYLK